MADLDIDNICRLCCEKKGRLRSLFEQKPAKDSLSLQQIILDVTRLEVGPGDGLPQKICKPCAITLVKMHETIEGYRSNDATLRKQILEGTLSTEVEIKEEEVDIEVLENTCLKDMMVENIIVKQEADEEYLDYEQLDEGKEFEPVEDGKPPEKDGSETDSADEVATDDVDELPKENDDEWLPEENPKAKRLKGRKTIPEEKPEKRKYTRRNPNDPQGYVRNRNRGNEPKRHRAQDTKCYICMSDSHGTPEALLAHLKSDHSDILPYTCSECVKETIVIKTIVSVNNHKRNHLNPEQCPHCDKRYTNKRSVDLHIEMYHKGANLPNPSTCEHCEKVCPSKLALNQHMRRHTRGVTCEICGKTFIDRHKLKRHIDSRHKKIRKYECQICKKKLADMSGLQNHIDTYHSNQVYTCSYCPRTFSSKATHRYHEKKHVEDPNYVATNDWKEYYTVLEGQEGKKKCKLCGVVLTHMSPHMTKVHFPVEYCCKICDTTYKNKYTYAAHMEKHELGKHIRCPICGREFTSRGNLISHLRTKKHRDHPLAQKMLGTVKTPAKKTKPEKANSEVVDDDSEAETQADSDEAIDSFM